jgi:hypothetical protein
VTIGRDQALAKSFTKLFERTGWTPRLAGHGDAPPRRRVLLIFSFILRRPLCMARKPGRSMPLVMILCSFSRQRLISRSTGAAAQPLGPISDPKPSRAERADGHNKWRVRYLARRGRRRLSAAVWRESFWKSVQEFDPLNPHPCECKIYGSLPWRVYFPLEPSSDDERNVRSSDRRCVVSFFIVALVFCGQQDQFRALLLG